MLDVLSVPKGAQQLEIETDVYAITLGQAQIITTPGELFPEVFYGVERNRRSDCPEARQVVPTDPVFVTEWQRGIDL